MKHETLDELQLRAEVVPSTAAPAGLTRRERIDRWVSLLENHRGRLRPFIRTEYLPRRERWALREDDTPVALAFGDPLLRADGLRDDSLGSAITYFGLSERAAHRLLCDCHYEGTMTGQRVAARLRSLAGGGIVQRIRDWMNGVA